jgi:hypothetical protein
MNDLTTRLEESLDRVNQLAQRSDELRASIVQKQVKGADELARLEADQGQLLSALSSARGAVGRLEAACQQRGQATAANLEQSSHSLEQLLSQLAARQTQTRQRIATLRQSLLSEGQRLDESEAQLLADLEHVRLELCSGMDKVTGLLNQSEHHLSQTVIPTLKSLEDQLKARTQKFHADVENHLLVRLDDQARQFGQKMLAISHQVVGHIQSTAGAASQQAGEHSQAFHKNSGTDWQSGHGEVDQPAVQRAAALLANGEQQHQAIHGLTQQMATATANFEQMMQGVLSRYSSIHGLPPQIDAILRQVGL